MKACFLLVLIYLLSSASLPAQSDSASTAQQIEMHSRKAQTYLQQKQPELAIPELQAVVALDPKNADSQGNLGVYSIFAAIT